VHRIGVFFGGTGSFEESALLVIWLQFILICVQVIQIATLFVLPPLAGLITIIAIALYLWLLVNFIAVLHGFTSLGMVFVTTLLSAFALLFVFSLILAVLGLACTCPDGYRPCHTSPWVWGKDSMYDVDKIRADFPILAREVNGKPLVYLDNGASAQKPQVVIDAITQAYSMEYANVHRGLHYLSNLATEKYEAVRGTIARFLGVADEDEIVFTSGTTEGINLVAYGWAMPRMQAGDEIVLSIAEHHANIVPWHFLRERQGVVMKWVDVDANGDLDPQAVIDAIGPKTKLVAITHMSNVLGTVVDVKPIIDAAHAKGVPVLVDGSQAAVHMAVDLDALGADFYAITGHKLYGPSGSGAIHIKRERMAEMRPFMGGGDMIREVHRDVVTWNDPPMKFEAGTPGIVQQIGLGRGARLHDGRGDGEHRRPRKTR
jgi:cysteine desulfurase/selenocysteine lyase